MCIRDRAHARGSMLSPSTTAMSVPEIHVPDLLGVLSSRSSRSLRETSPNFTQSSQRTPKRPQRRSIVEIRLFIFQIPRSSSRRTIYLMTSSLPHGIGFPKPLPLLTLSRVCREIYNDPPITSHFADNVAKCRKRHYPPLSPLNSE